jgi:hypothetical protein
VGETRACAQCGTRFGPRREHARFCSARCRQAWNREHTGDAASSVNALDWSMTAMEEAIERVGRLVPGDLPRAVAAVSEAVWWVTIVDATLVRYHPGTYDAVLASEPGGRRRRIEDTLAGFRHVRNQMGRALDPAEFIGAAGAVVRGAATGWVWNQVPEPDCAELSARGLDWELTRYRAYQSRLTGQGVAETFALAGEFLLQTAAAAPAA